MKKKYLLGFLFTIICFCSNAKVTLPDIISSNMVLQQQSNVNLWGKAKANAKITIKTSWDKKSYSLTADKEGKWLQKVSTPTAGGPYTISISDGEELILDNVLIGEVWICSGQSNMEHTMTGYSGQPTEHSLEYINKAKESRNIRIATIKKNHSTTPLEDCETEWLTHTPGAVKQASAVAYYFAYCLQDMLDVPVGIICSAWGGSKIEAWMEKDIFVKNYPDTDLSFLADNGKINARNQQPTLLYNAMIKPISNYNVRGAIWYQGEANRDTPELYKDMQVKMMNSWRKTFNNPNMPFYYVQIAPYRYNDEKSFDSGFFYEAQQEIMKMDSNCGMALTIDSGDRNFIHPKYKREVGNRLAYWALAKTYNKEVECEGPTYKSMEIEGNKIILSFNDGNTGIWTSTPSIKGFEIAGEDKIFYPAKARIINKKTIELYNDNVKAPVAARYCFRNFQPGCIYNNYHLPLAPFRTDRWEK